jgi:hypothetical protein
MGTFIIVGSLGGDMVTCVRLQLRKCGASRLRGCHQGIHNDIFWDEEDNCWLREQCGGEHPSAVHDSACHLLQPLRGACLLSQSNLQVMVLIWTYIWSR